MRTSQLSRQLFAIVDKHAKHADQLILASLLAVGQTVLRNIAQRLDRNRVGGNNLVGVFVEIFFFFFPGNNVGGRCM